MALPPKVSLPVNGTAPNQYATKDGLEGVFDAALAILQSRIDEKAAADDLKPVATTGAYEDLSGKPTLGTAAAQDSNAFATAEQGEKAETAIQPDALAVVDDRLSDVITATVRETGFQPLLSDDLLWAIPGDRAGPAVTREGAFYARMPLIEGQPFLSSDYRHIIAADEHGKPLIAVGVDGELRLATAAWALSDRWFHADIDEGGRVLTGWTSDGEPFLGPVGPVDWRCEVRGEQGAQEVYICAEGMPEMQASVRPGRVGGVVIRGAWLSWITYAAVGALGVLRRLSLDQQRFAAGITSVQYFAGYGQSLSLGTGSTPVQTATPPYPGRLKMFTGGVVVGSTFHLSELSIGDIVDAVSTTREAPVTQAATAVLAARQSSIGAVVATHAVGGQLYEAIRPGTVPYENVLSGIRRAVFFAHLQRLSISVPAMIFTHGETDRATSAETYKGYLEELASTCALDVQALTGQVEPPILLIEQMSNWSGFSDGLSRSEVPLAQLDAALSNPNAIYCIGPKYTLATYDGIHLRGPQSANLGARQGRALNQITAGTWTGPLYATQATRSGQAVTLQFNIPYGGAGIDLHTALVTDPGNYGLEWIDDGDGNIVSVTEVAVSGRDQLIVALSAIPTGSNGRIGIAATATAGAAGGPNTGPRSCIRSAAADLDINGAAMDHYACHQIINITE